MSYNSWEEAFYAQAIQDFELAKTGAVEIKKHGAAVCMLLQMFFEKYAKAIYCHLNHCPPPRSHRTTKAFLSVLRGSAKYSKYKKANGISNWKKDKRQFLDFFDFITKLEALQPSNANSGKIEDDSPQLEYPWRCKDMNLFYAPCSDLDITHEIEDPNSRLFSKILPIAKNLIDDFPRFCETNRFP